MAMQGGGTTRHKDVKTYIDLVVKDFGDLEKEYPQTADLFKAFAKHRQGAANFGYAELAKDKRLFNLLSQTKEGLDFYSRLESIIPVVTVSNSILGNVYNIKNVRTFCLSDLEENPLKTLEKIQKEARLITHSDKSGFLDGIEKLNKIISLKPGLFGCSININGLIDGWLNNARMKLENQKA